MAYRIVPLTTDTADGFTPAKREERLSDMLDAYGSGSSPTDLRTVAVKRLLELANLSNELAVTTNKPELSQHAAMYRQDAAAPG